jgi:peptide/nickel transport system substrate-binding protein
MGRTLTAAVIAAALAVGAAAPAGAKTLKWAFQGDAQSLDPYGLNETFTLGLLGNVYEGLTRRDKDLKIQPALATSWEIMEPLRWRFHLRKGVKFHNGSDFNADDVIFSWKRVAADGSDLKTRMATVKEFIKVDDHTVDVITTVPNPILNAEWDSWYMMDKEWATSNNAVEPQNVTKGIENFATRNANGTGPFVVVSRETGVKTVLQANPNWWDKREHNIDEVVFTPISNDATRVAALLSGEVDFMDPIPVQDIDRVNKNKGTKALVGPETRTIFLGFDQERDELKYSNIKGKNPFKDKRVRQAFYQAIDIEAIKAKVMRGLATPSAIMIAPVQVEGADQFKRLAYDPDGAKKLLAEAGYPSGFEVGMDCPNDRYVNDEQICQASVAMLARIGIKVNLLAQPKALYFKKVLRPSADTSFYLLGWTPGSNDGWNVLFNILGTPEASGRGKFNLGGYGNKNLDALTDKILVETDIAKRKQMMIEAFKISVDDVSYVPLHQQNLVWGVRDTLEVAQRADNIVMLYRMRMK